MKKMLGLLQSERYLRDSIVRKQAKRYVEMYIWYDKLPDEDLPF